jgi:broad specificity phosphatase PhoE
MTRMLLTRHGQSVWNAEGRWQGQADPALSDLGRQQALTAAGRLGVVDAIISSPLQRALDTACIISEALGVGPVVVEPDLCERDAGEWSGLTRPDIDERWPGYLDAGRRPPGYEPDDAVLERCLGALARIEAAFRGGELLVVCHGGVVGTLERHHGLDHGRLPNLAARWLRHDGSRVTLGERLVLVDPDELTVPAQI